MNHDRVPVSNVGSAHIITLANLDCAVCNCPVEQQARQWLVETNRLVSEGNAR
ncbi:hypothetical protein [Nocardia nova]|uniref:hypothetical protein n=1 Tax=Nocardia nova TaxID=37330 RepID=UPI002738EE17|nr:hypothetical protein [Nocardia nova]